jgi:transposase, IS30 family
MCLPMTKKRGQLKSEERHVLYAYLREGLSLRSIAGKMQRAVSSLSEEVKVSGGRENYNPLRAHFNACLRRWQANSTNPLKSAEVWKYVKEKLEEGWSPQQISERIKEDYTDNNKMRISHETIYQFVNSKEGRELDLAKKLRRKKFRKLRKGRMESVNPKKQRIRNRIPIHDRPEAVNGKERCGDWESDLMEGRRGSKHCLSVQKERKTQYVCLRRVKDKTAEENTKAVTDNLSVLPQELRLTITYDNGPENTEHEEINDILGTLSYFCDPYCSWQKGSVENVIGLVREYFPKGTDLSKVTDDEIQAVQDRLNNRPRKSLNYLTPHEVLSSHLKKLGVRFPG